MNRRLWPKASEPPAAPPPAETEIPAEIAPPVRPPSKSRDRRAQTRHEVDTVATILLVKVGSALRGRILDLSLSGCRIRTDERFPVGIYTRVETEFHLEGLPFRLGGVIQAIHNRNMVGIRFLDLSERKRQQVLDLIDEIEQMRARCSAPSLHPQKSNIRQTAAEPMLPPLCAHLMGATRGGLPDDGHAPQAAHGVGDVDAHPHDADR